MIALWMLLTISALVCCIMAAEHLSHIRRAARANRNLWREVGWSAISVTCFLLACLFVSKAV